MYETQSILNGEREWMAQESDKGMGYGRPRRPSMAVVGRRLACAID